MHAVMMSVTLSGFSHGVSLCRYPAGVMPVTCDASSIQNASIGMQAFDRARGKPRRPPQRMQASRQRNAKKPTHAKKPTRQETDVSSRWHVKELARQFVDTWPLPPS